MAKFPFTLLRALIPVSMVLPLLHCDVSRCEKKRDELSALKDKWGPCDTSFDCIKVFGNDKDCTGILSCDFAVNRVYRQEAERRVASLPEETVDCIECQPPNCVSGDLAYCEPVTQRCIVITELLGGSPGIATEPRGGMASVGTGGMSAGGGGGAP
jgi:hypothetical protein